jgi:protein-S-isoprenylcysteine O-methyltransferase Ste14
MTAIVFAISTLAGLTLVALSIASLLSEAVQFWPPPSRNTWQYRVFWLLFRIIIIGVILLSVLDFRGNGNISLFRLVVGFILMFSGFGLGFYATFYLGWKNAHGEPEGLKTSGCYRWSRNPIYVVSLVGIFGIGLFVNSGYLNGVLFLWALIYITAPYLEEPWLEQKYGEDYSIYKAKVPRFIGIPSGQSQQGS